MNIASDLDERANLLNLVANRTRLRMFYLLDRMGEVCVCDLASILNVTQSAISQHLSKFRALSLVETRRAGQTLFYRLSSAPEVNLLKQVAIEGIEL
jgi:ArsR family transcriptional regulator, lead/cadmium/zinc/bismuth-responsive transcriptional repressor